MARLWFCPSIVQYTRTRKLKSRIDSLEKKLKCQDTRRQSTTRSLALSALRPGTLSGLGSTGLDSTSQNNIWWSLTKRGWWKIDYTIEPNDIDLEHIAEEVKKGNEQGEIIQEDDEN